MGQWTIPGDIGDYLVSHEKILTPANSLPFCELDTLRQVPALMGPDHRLLSEKEVVPNSQPSKPIKMARDAAGDDHGLTGEYTYPTNPQFEAGIADILEFELSENESSYEFELTMGNLVDPGWHPEYGYQLTYCAVAISYNSTSGTSELGKNSKAQFQAGFRADQILYTSGGILLVDDHHKPIAEYMPKTLKGAIGKTETKQIKFSLPKELFLHPLAQADFQIAAGCQDDHGGAGIGDFRPVNLKGSEWTGGGGSESESNVYDWLIF